MAEMEKGVLEIPDATPESVQGMINFIYTGSIPSNISDMVEDLLHLADKYGLGRLKKACETCLVDDLAVENAVNTMIYADRWGMRTLYFSIYQDESALRF